jgi:hypothetical protein
MKHLLDKRMITANGRVKGRGLAKRDSAHCVFFCRKGKSTKSMRAQRFFGELPETTDCFCKENSKRLQGDRQRRRRVSTAR